MAGWIAAHCCIVRAVENDRPPRRSAQLSGGGRSVVAKESAATTQLTWLPAQEVVLHLLTVLPKPSGGAALLQHRHAVTLAQQLPRGSQPTRTCADHRLRRPGGCWCAGVAGAWPQGRRRRCAAGHCLSARRCCAPRTGSAALGCTRLVHRRLWRSRTASQLRCLGSVESAHATIWISISKRQRE